MCAKHRSTVYRKPISDHTRRAFMSVLPLLLDRRESRAPCILDSCCGTAQSTLYLARKHPQSFVLGIDRSHVRLQAAPDLPSNAVVLRAECADFWRLCAESNIVFVQHMLWYPNPYPKSEHLVRRWYAHPVFPTLLSISHELELRSNMQWYVDDTATVLKYYDRLPSVQPLPPMNDAEHGAATAFEKKYGERGESLWQLRCVLQQAT